MLPIVFKPESVVGDFDSSQDTYNRNIITYPNLLNQEEVSGIIEYGKSNSGLHRRGSKSSLVTASFSTCLLTEYNHYIYTKLENIWNEMSGITFIEPYEIKIYTKNDSFGAHHDNYVNKEQMITRKHLLVVQLSDPSDYEGGNLVVGNIEIEKKLGMGIIFPACYLHYVTPITSGERITLIGHSWGNM